jgi:tripeptide aminopeptidase
MINKQRTLAEFFELTRIDCSTRAEREVADILKSRLSDLGLVVMEDDAGQKIGGNCGNIIAYLEGTAGDAPVLLLSAHMDCVQPCAGVEPQLKDGVITSKGNTVLGADDKAGIVAIMESLRVVRETGMNHGGIQVVFTVAEEGGLNGSKNVDRSLLKADLGYALDSDRGPGEIITKAPGQNRIHVVIHGRTAHAGIAPEEGINAIVIAGKALAQLKYGRIDAETTANIGVIKGGHGTNIVPDRVEVLCEARSRDSAKLSAQTNHMRDTFEKIAAANGGRAEVTVEMAYDSYVLADDAPVVRLAVGAAQNSRLIPVLGVTGGGSDANCFNTYGIPVAVLGIGMTKVHTNDEYIKEEDLYKMAEYVTALIAAAGKLKK